MLSELGKVNKQTETSSGNGELQESRIQEAPEASEVSEISQKGLEEETIVLHPNIELIKTRSFESVKQNNLEKAKRTIAENSEVKAKYELSNGDKQCLKDMLRWSDKQIEKCKIYEDGVIYYRTDREDLEGKTSENGVPYERKMVEINEMTVEGVFPVFNSVFDAQLPEGLLKASNPKQFNECNRQLKEGIINDAGLEKGFTEDQLEDIENGDTPEGYTWHHNEEVGKMQLVKTEDHDRTQGGAAHTGGKALWGGKYESIVNIEPVDIIKDNSEV